MVKWLVHIKKSPAYKSEFQWHYDSQQLTVYKKLPGRKKKSINKQIENCAKAVRPVNQSLQFFWEDVVGGEGGDLSR